ncbi:hypothetical protein G6F57_023467 [Rhizopus arrhizus]|nr:hypothetical protein G6F57_023467 [Rhizopus arrhizus]
MAARLEIGVSRQAANAASAASTARRASSASDTGKSPTTSDVSAGLRLGAVRPVALGTQAPPMWFMNACCERSSTGARPLPVREWPEIGRLR